jgi:hypothetical protein
MPATSAIDLNGAVTTGTGQAGRACITCMLDRTFSALLRDTRGTRDLEREDA